MKAITPKICGTGYQCAHCRKIFCWSCEALIPEQPSPRDVAIKTIGSRYCNADVCVAADAKAHGLPIEVVKAFRAKRTHYQHKDCVRYGAEP